MIFFFFANMVVSIVTIFESRFYTVCQFAWKPYWKRWRKVGITIYHVVYSCLVIPFVFLAPDQETAIRSVFAKLPRLPQYIYEANIYVLCEDYTYHLFSLVAILISACVMVFSFSILLMWNAVVQLKSRTMSQKTFQLQKSFLISLGIQILIPVCTFALPGIYLWITILVDYYDQSLNHFTDTKRGLQVAVGKLATGLLEKLSLKNFDKIITDPQDLRLQEGYYDSDEDEAEAMQYMNQHRNQKYGEYYGTPQEEPSKSKQTPNKRSTPRDHMEEEQHHYTSFNSPASNKKYENFDKNLIKFDGSGKLSIFKRIFIDNVIKNPTLSDDEKYIQLEKHLSGPSAKCMQRLDNTRKAINLTLFELEQVYGETEDLVDAIKTLKKKNTFICSRPNTGINEIPAVHGAVFLTNHQSPYPPRYNSSNHQQQNYQSHNIQERPKNSKFQQYRKDNSQNNTRDNKSTRTPQYVASQHANQYRDESGRILPGIYAPGFDGPNLSIIRYSFPFPAPEIRSTCNTEKAVDTKTFLKFLSEDKHHINHSATAEYDDDYKLPFICLYTPNGESVRALVDSGASLSLIDHRAAEKIQLELLGSTTLNVAGFGSTVTIPSNVYKLPISTTRNKTFSFKVAGSPQLPPTKFQFPTLSKEDVQYLKNKNISFEDQKDNSLRSDKNIDMIMGNDIISWIQSQKTTRRAILPSGRLLEITPFGLIFYPTPNLGLLITTNTIDDVALKPSDSQSIVMTILDTTDPEDPLTKLIKELTAIIMGTNLAIAAKKEIPIPVVEICFLTDSSISFFWILKEHTTRPYVSNRVNDYHINKSWIEKTGTEVALLHCPTEFNPADAATRGLTTTEYNENQQWPHGPKFLLDGREEWPNKIEGSITNVKEFHDLVFQEIVDPVTQKRKRSRIPKPDPPKAETIMLVNTEEKLTSIVPFYRTNSMRKLVTIVHKTLLAVCKAFPNHQWESFVMKQFTNESEDQPTLRRKMARTFTIQQHYIEADEQDNENTDEDPGYKSIPNPPLPAIFDIPQAEYAPKRFKDSKQNFVPSAGNLPTIGERDPEEEINYDTQHLDTEPADGEYRDPNATAKQIMDYGKNNYANSPGSLTGNVGVESGFSFITLFIVV
ncbi:hypothetical protein L5515_006540 [Caenorhabditis briggsae]|uniref:Peptidase A2 domain-containing protein n=1 Tax=Caenorhabditis briggsae TaxID=6238 RepID=A0AAE9EW78_CAEBR|nr:hypothetical protein L5515_006540 [Caenorhabditis briggsae]